MSRRIAVLAAALVATAAARACPAASASRFLQHGIFDDTQINYGNPDQVFPMLQQLQTQVIRVNLVWGGPNGVAKRRPVNPMNPNDPAYDWSVYDRTVTFAAAHRIKVVFSILGTPPWANGAAGAERRAAQRCSTSSASRPPPHAATTAPSGRPTAASSRRCAPGSPGTSRTTRPSSGPSTGRSRGKSVIQSAIDYAKICNAVVKGVRKTTIGASKVACGVTGPRGNNNPNSARPAVSPLPFLRAMKKAGAKGFDAYAHHPYYGAPRETPSTPPPPGIHGNAPTAITLGNINVLIKEVTRLYGNKRIWITEYGYQTNPPDRIFGVSDANQARYLTQAYGIAKRIRGSTCSSGSCSATSARLTDEGWQSGLLTAGGRKKPSFAAFQKLRG